MNTPRLILATTCSAVIIIGAYVLGTHHTADSRAPDAHPPGAIAIRSAAASPAQSSAGTSASSSAADTAKLAQSPATLLARIAAFKIAPNDAPGVRRLLAELERLKDLGPAALPALREFLASGQDADYDFPFTKFGFKDGKVPLDFAVPPSLRLALLEVAKNIGGPDAEALLARELKTTGRGVEAGYIASALQQLAPEKYRDASATAARDLLATPLSTITKNSVDRYDREYLYNILTAAGDTSQVPQAKAQLILPNGQIDRGALRYLNEALGPASLDVAQSTWNDPRVPPAQREPLARVALTWAGMDDHADQFYATAIADPNLSPNARKNLIEDLNQDGFANPKQLTTADLPLIQRRLALIDQLAPRTTDAVSTAAFAEARKDLLAMREKAQVTPFPKK